MVWGITIHTNDMSLNFRQVVIGTLYRWRVPFIESLYGLVSLRGANAQGDYPPLERSFYE